MDQTFWYNGAFAQIAEGDAKEFLESLEDESVDLLITSPPYFVGKEYDASTSVTDFLTEFRRTLPEIRRIIKENGNICWQVGNHVVNGKVIPLDALIVSELMFDQELELKNRIIWTFGHGNHATKRFSGRHETILWYGKGEEPYFDLDPIRVPQKYPGKRHYKGPNKGLYSGNPKGKNPGDFWDLGSIWDIPNVKANHIEKTNHPCQFPVALARRVIEALSPSSSLVVDPYMGSGSVALASLLEGRHFSGIDAQPMYVGVCEERLYNLEIGCPLVRRDEPAIAPDRNSAVSTRPPHFVGGEFDDGQDRTG